MVTNHPTLIATAWSGMLAVLLAMLLVDVLRHAMQGDWQGLSDTLAHDPGPLGLRVLLSLLCLNVLVQVAVQIGQSPAFRTGVLVLTALYAGFFVAHQLVHLVKGEKPGLHTLLDLTHHALGAVATWSAWQWVGQA